MLIRGRCHCANIAFTLRVEPDPAEIPARACTCSFCAKHGGLWTSYPGGTLEVSIEDAAEVSKYMFGTRTAEFHICTRCGVVPVVTSLIEGRIYAVVNVNTFEGINPALIRRTPASFDGEGEGPRLARRRRNWIADVRMPAKYAAPGRIGPWVLFSNAPQPSQQPVPSRRGSGNT